MTGVVVRELWTPRTWARPGTAIRVDVQLAGPAGVGVTVHLALLDLDREVDRVVRRVRFGPDGEATARLLAMASPTAFVCASDSLALGALAATRPSGMAAPVSPQAAPAVVGLAGNLLSAGVWKPNGARSALCTGPEKWKNSANA